ncbi:terminase large subunit [bacterium]|nr:terminase large subunit [bacterium]
MGRKREHDIAPAMQYAENILSGRIPACKWTKLAVERHVRDLERAENDPEYPYFFSEDAAWHVIDFFHKYLHHSIGEWAGRLFELSPWQQFILWSIFGWLKKEEETRRFKVVYIDMARKNGKSSMASGVGLYLFDADGEPGAQIYTAATKYKQAKIVHAEAERMVKSSPFLRRRIGIVRDNLHVIDTASKFEPLGRDSKTEDGLNVHGAIIDEYHAHPDSGLYDVLRTAMGSRRQPMMFVITTAGYEKQCPCYIQREYVTSILEGVFEDDSVFGIIYTLDEEEKDEKGNAIRPADDWTDERTWIKANPNLNVSLKLSDLREMCREAIQSPTKQNEFKTKRLNLWTEAVIAWITQKSWNACAFPVNAEGLRGRTCYGGLDLSTVNDLTAWVLCFPPQGDDRLYQFLYRFFLPQDGLRERCLHDRVPYDLWINKGFVMATPGNVIDYSFIEAQVLEDAARYDLKEIAYDPYNASQVVLNLQDQGLKMIEFRQGFLSMSPASKDFERRVLAAEIAHGGNPVMNWMVNCATIATDPAGNIKPVKPDRMTSSKRIDGVVASIMALWRAVINEDETESTYDSNEVFVA